MNEKRLSGFVYAAACMLLIHCIAGLALLFLLMKVVPEYMELFRDFDAELPVVTQWMMSISVMVVHYWYLLVSLGLGVDIAFFLGLSQLPSGTRWVAVAWFSLVLAAMVLLAGFVVVALYLPLQDLSTRLH